jgi:hypothetical protein
MKKYLATFEALIERSFEKLLAAVLFAIIQEKELNEREKRLLDCVDASAACSCGKCISR